MHRKDDDKDVELHTRTKGAAMVHATLPLAAILYRHLHLDGGIWVVALDCEVAE